MRRLVIPLLSLGFLVGSLQSQYLAELPLTPLPFDAAALKEAFNAASTQPRLIAVMSPT
jgi:hypothetical protein